jgi:single-strand DNA-binding protein
VKTRSGGPLIKGLEVPRSNDEGVRKGEKNIMGKSVNKIILLGNVGMNPEIKSTSGGTLVANLSLATSDRYKDKQGELRERTEWHNLVAYARGAEIMRDYVKKGSKLYVEGKLSTRSWDDKDTGKKVYRTEVIINDFSLLSASEAAGTRGDGSAERGSQNIKNNHTSREGHATEDYGDLGITDSDVPF